MESLKTENAAVDIFIEAGVLLQRVEPLWTKLTTTQVALPVKRVGAGTGDPDPLIKTKTMAIARREYTTAAKTEAVPEDLFT